MGSQYSTNIRNIDKINRFFVKIGYTPQYEEKTEEAAIGIGERVVRFMVSGFKPLELEGKLLEEWQNLPVEIAGKGQVKEIAKEERARTKEIFQKKPGWAYDDASVPYDEERGFLCPQCGAPTDVGGELCLRCCLS